MAKSLYKQVIVSALLTFACLVIVNTLFPFSNSQSSPTSIHPQRGDQFRRIDRKESFEAASTGISLTEKSGSPPSFSKYTEDSKPPIVSTSKASNIGILTAESASIDIDAINSYSSSNLPYRSDISWKQFVDLPRMHNVRKAAASEEGPLNPGYRPIFCSRDVEVGLSSPKLSHKQAEWCDWALSPSGAGVVVGKSWGRLKTVVEKQDFDEFNCNAYSKGVNPTCNDAWGDEHLRNWMKSAVSSIGCLPGASSRVSCIDNENTDRQCQFHNVQINFDLATDVKRSAPSTTPSKSFKKGFFSVDCNPNGPSNYLKFEHLYDTKLSSQKCDYVINGTVLLFSHDDIRNLGHTMNDIMNVWVMLWLNGMARVSSSMTFLNIDSFNLGHNFMDNITSPFYTTYKKNFFKMLSGRDFGRSTVCLQHVLMQPSPPKFFVWESWFKDNECTFRGPSTLFQRFNMATRHSYGHLGNTELHPTSSHFRVLVVVRKQSKNIWGSAQTSRNTMNQDEVSRVLESSVKLRFPTAEILTVCFEKMTFEEQISAAATSSIIIGMHGAGLTQAMHMPVGTKYCCGMIEIFPDGDYTPIRGHGNMVRRVGIRYERIDIAAADSHPEGAVIPAQRLGQLTVQLMDDLTRNPTCLLKSVYQDPYFDIAV